MISDGDVTQCLDSDFDFDSFQCEAEDLSTLMALNTSSDDDEMFQSLTLNCQMCMFTQAILLTGNMTGNMTENITEAQEMETVTNCFPDSFQCEDDAAGLLAQFGYSCSAAIAYGQASGVGVSEACSMDIGPLLPVSDVQDIFLAALCPVSCGTAPCCLETCERGPYDCEEFQEFTGKGGCASTCSEEWKEDTAKEFCVTQPSVGFSVVLTDAVDVKTVDKAELRDMAAGIMEATKETIGNQSNVTVVVEIVKKQATKLNFPAPAEFDPAPTSASYKALVSALKRAACSGRTLCKAFVKSLTVGSGRRLLESQVNADIEVSQVISDSESEEIASLPDLSSETFITSVSTNLEEDFPELATAVTAATAQVSAETVEAEIVITSSDDDGEDSGDSLAVVQTSLSDTQTLATNIGKQTTLDMNVVSVDEPELETPSPTQLPAGSPTNLPTLAPTSPTSAPAPPTSPTSAPTEPPSAEVVDFKDAGSTLTTFCSFAVMLATCLV